MTKKTEEKNNWKYFVKCPLCEDEFPARTNCSYCEGKGNVEISPLVAADEMKNPGDSYYGTSGSSPVIEGVFGAMFIIGFTLVPIIAFVEAIKTKDVMWFLVGLPAFGFLVASIISLKE